MATGVCDLVPCDMFLLARREKLITVDGFGRYAIHVPSPKRPQQFTESIGLTYCPFCGTRIDETWPAQYPVEDFLHKHDPRANGRVTNSVTLPRRQG